MNMPCCFKDIHEHTCLANDFDFKFLVASGPPQVHPSMTLALDISKSTKTAKPGSTGRSSPKPCLPCLLRPPQRVVRERPRRPFRRPKRRKAPGSTGSKSNGSTFRNETDGLCHRCAPSIDRALFNSVELECYGYCGVCT